MLGKNLAFEEGTLKIRVIEARKLEIGYVMNSLVQSFFSCVHDGVGTRTSLRYDMKALKTGQTRWSSLESPQAFRIRHFACM